MAIVAVAAGVLWLALAAVPVPEESYLLSMPLRAWLRFGEILRQLPWEEGALVANLWLEVLHRARPWHTAVLGAALIAYLSSLAATTTCVRLGHTEARQRLPSGDERVERRVWGSERRPSQGAG